jgi:carboxymethylenebutenolidase
MKKIKKEDINEAVFELYDKYAHNKLDRRKFIDRLSIYAVGGLTVPSLLSFLMPDYINKIQIKQDDPRLTSIYLEYNSPKGAGKMRGLLTMPKDTKKKLPGVIVVHENRGLNPHIEDVARRTALEGYIAFAPDALFPLGGYPGTDDEGRTLQRKRDRDEMLEDFIAAFDVLKEHKKCTGKVGVVGFCFGGSISNNMAVHVPELKAAVPFYGGQAAIEDVPKIKAPLLLHFAELDKRVNAGWPAYEAALKEHNKEYTAYIYPGVQHGFHNDTTPRYNKEAATLAWQRTVAFFNDKLD